jgi:hypothetical protein
VVAVGVQLRLDPYPIFGPTLSLSYQKVRFLPNLSCCSNQNQTILYLMAIGIFFGNIILKNFVN